jgi:hypothetical protein
MGEDDAKALAEAVLTTIELALRIAGRHPVTPRERIVWDVSDPPDLGWEREDEWT